MNNIHVQTKSINQEICDFKIDFVSIVLYQSATFRVSFYNNQNERIQKCYMTIQGEEYTNWGHDDTYIIDLVCDKFNLTLYNKSTETETETHIEK